MSEKYRKFKQRLREEFLYECGYCGTREPEAGGATAFHADHYKPKSKFPALINIYDNLIYACRKCNSHKGNYWHSMIEGLRGEVVLNPKTDNVVSHIDKSCSEWIGLTGCGSWNIKFLHLSDRSQIQRREDRREIEGLIKERIENRRRCDRNINDPRLSPNERQIYKEMIEKYDIQIKTLRRKIEGPMD